MVKAYALALLLPTLLLGAVPSITRPVTDPGGLLSAEDTERVARELVQLRDETGVQMAVLLVGSTEGEPIEDYALRVTEEWKGGRAGEDNGLLFVLAVDDRRMRLEVGYGLEEYLPDDAVRRLLDAQLPLMREQDYAGALVHIIRDVRVRLPEGAFSSSQASSWSPYRRAEAFRVLLWVAGVLFVWICFVHHPGLRNWWGDRRSLVLSAGAALLALGFAIYTAWGGGASIGVLLLSFCLVCGSALGGRFLLFKGGFARVGIALILGPLVGCAYASFQDIADSTSLFTEAFNTSLIASAVVVVGSFESFFNLLLIGIVYLVGGREAGRSFGNSISHAFTFTVSGSSSSSSSSGGSSSSGSSWGGGGGGFGGGGASSSW